MRLCGAIVTSFLPLEAALDEAVCATVALGIERAGVPMSLEVAVQVRVFEAESWIKCRALWQRLGACNHDPQARCFCCLSWPVLAYRVLSVFLQQDLHDVTPDTFLEMAGGVLHSLSYQQVWVFACLGLQGTIPVSF